ncbi:MAG: DUF433 domain-containing protein [Ignavibacteria bacterium]|nr:DUF433 domain-containing protein [Ignavibacteria bacterium]
MNYPYIIDKEILGGEPVFRNSRVPIKILFEYLEAGKSITDFLGNYPSVENKYVIQLLEISLKYLENNYPLFVADK